MKKSILVLAVASLASVAVHAEDANPLSFNIGVFTDYRFRGISQTRLQPALQLGADYAFASGFYVGTWLSTIRWIEDAGKAANVQVGSTSLEWDLYAGYKGEIAKDFSYDVGALAYYYPGNKLYNIPGARNAHTGELYGALTYGPATVKYSHAVTTLFGFDKSRNSGYLEAAASFDVGSGFSITPHIGYQKVRGNSDFSYTDYSVTGSKDFSGFVVSLALVGAETKSIGGVKAYASPANGKDLGRSTVVLGVKTTF